MANTNNWDYSYNLSSRWEGGISKDKKDRGNQNKLGDTIYYTNTYYGLTFKAWLEYKGKDYPTTAEEFNTLNTEFSKTEKSDVKDYFKSEIWDKNNLGDIKDEKVAASIYDAMMNQGYALGGANNTTLEKVLKDLEITDYDISTQEKAIEVLNKAIEEKGGEAVTNSYAEVREESYIKSSRKGENHAFGKGWMNRLNDHRTEGIVDTSKTVINTNPAVGDTGIVEIVRQEPTIIEEKEEKEDIMGDLSLEPIPSVQASTRVVDPSIQSQIDNGSLIDNGDGTYTRINEDGSKEILIQSLDADGNSELIPREEGEPVPEGSVVADMPQHPSKNPDVDNDGVPDVVDTIDNRIVTTTDEVVTDEEVISPEVTVREPDVGDVDDNNNGIPDYLEVDIEGTEGEAKKRTGLEVAGATAGALFEGAGSLLDAIGGPGAIISYVMGKKGLEAAMKEVKPHKMPELSPMFHQHLRQVKELAKQGFTANEERKIRKDIDGAYQSGLENAVRGTSGDRAKFLATSGILDSKRASALLEFSAKDAELQRENQDDYAEMMMFKENFDAQRSEKLRAEDMQMQLANKQSAAQFTSAAFSNLMNIGGGNTALINKMMQQFAGGNSTTTISNELNP